MLVMLLSKSFILCLLPKGVFLALPQMCFVWFWVFLILFLFFRWMPPCHLGALPCEMGACTIASQMSRTSMSSDRSYERKCHTGPCRELFPRIGGHTPVFQNGLRSFHELLELELDIFSADIANQQPFTHLNWKKYIVSQKTVFANASLPNYIDVWTK